MIIDCESCPVRGVRCDGCMVGALYALEAPGAATLALDPGERSAVTMLVEAGLVDPDVARDLQARREPWSFQAVG